MNRIKLILLFSLMLFFTFSFWSVNAQETIVSNDDAFLKEAIYNENKVKVSNFSFKQFDELFFEFFNKKGNPNLVLTKQEFYNYTIQIAIFSDRLASLYPDQKEIAEQNKKKWFAETYQDYLFSKKSQKK